MTAAQDEPKASGVHTPGPWTYRRAKYPVDGSYDYAIAAKVGGQEFCIIAEAFGRVADAVWPDAEANARLIAAAPDLLAALKDVVAVADRKTDEFDRARAAIAKAEGRS